MLLVADDHPLAGDAELHVRDLEGFELALPAPHTASARSSTWPPGNAGTSLSPKAEIDGLRLLLSIALRGYGPALLPATTLSDPPPGFKTLRVPGLPLRHVGLALRKRGRPSAPTTALIEVLESVVDAYVAAHGHLHEPVPRPPAGTSAPTEPRRLGQAKPERRSGGGAGAGRRAGCRRDGSSRPPPGCRCAAPPRSHVAGPDRQAGGNGAASCMPSRPVMSKTSSPVRPSDAADSPARNCRGRTPMPMRLERWMRSKLSASTAARRAAPCPWPPSPATTPSRTPGRPAPPAACPRLDVPHGGVVDGGLLARRAVGREPALGPGGQLVAQAHVGERAPHHDLVVAPA